MEVQVLPTFATSNHPALIIPCQQLCSTQSQTACANSAYINPGHYSKQPCFVNPCLPNLIQGVDPVERSPMCPTHQPIFLRHRGQGHQRPNCPASKRGTVPQRVFYWFKNHRQRRSGSLCFFVFPQTVYCCWGSIFERKELATLTGRAPELCGWAPWLSSVAGPCPPPRP